MARRRTPPAAAAAPAQAPAAVRGLILFAHGSRDPAWREPFERLLADLRERDPARPVVLAFLELMTPSLPEALEAMAAAGTTAIRVVPLFLAPGRHTRRDLPGLVADFLDRRPGVDVAIAPTVLESAVLRAALAERLVDAPGDGAVQGA